MSENLGFEYVVLKHYLHKGVFARAGLIDLLIRETRGYSRTDRVAQETGLDAKEATAALQIAVISHIMMWTEDVAVLCKAILDGKINYYDYLDNSGDQDLGRMVGEFYETIDKLSDREIAKILSFADASSWKYVMEGEREVVCRVQARMIARTRRFFDKLAMFKDNHHPIFRRYKHAGFPLLLAQPLPDDTYDTGSFEFATLGLTSKRMLGEEVVPIPFSQKAIESYENLKNDILAFLGNVTNFKVICLERGVEGLTPHTHNLFGIDVTPPERTVLDIVWKRFEAEHPVLEGKTPDGFNSSMNILKWYEDIDNSAKRVLGS